MSGERKHNDTLIRNNDLQNKAVHKRVNKKKVNRSNVSVASVALASTLAMILPSSAAAQVSLYKQNLSDDGVIREVHNSTKKNNSEALPLSPLASDSSKRTASRLVREVKKIIVQSEKISGNDTKDGANNNSINDLSNDFSDNVDNNAVNNVNINGDADSSVENGNNAENTEDLKPSKKEEEVSVNQEQKSEVKSEPNSEVKAEPESEIKAGPVSEDNTEAKSSPKIEVKTEQKYESKSEPESEPKSEQKSEQKPEQKSEPENEQNTEQKPEPKDATNTEPKLNKNVEIKPAEKQSREEKSKDTLISSTSTSSTSSPSTSTPSTSSQPSKESAAKSKENVSNSEVRSEENAANSSSSSNNNSQVITPNNSNTKAQNVGEANKQVQTDEKPSNTYNLKILYTLGGAPNKQLVQPYELTIDTKKLNELGNSNNYEYIPIPQTSGYSPQITYSGNYKYFVKDASGNFVEDNGTYGQKAQRYLQLSKSLINSYCNQKDDKTGTYSGQIVIDYAPHIANYYVRHLLQSKENPEEFDQDYAVGTDVIRITTTGDDGRPVTKEIHVTKHKGTVGYNVYPQALDIPGYEPEHNLVSSPLSDKADDKDNKLVLNLRYYRKTYEVTYDTDGGTDITAQRVYYGVKIPEVKDPTKRGYTFAGWQVVDSSGKPVPKQPNISDVIDETHTLADEASFPMPNGDVHFKARWKANETTSYRVNVWVQKADLVDEEHPESLKNYDFVTTVVRNNVKTGSNVALDKMENSGEIADANASSSSANNAVENPYLGLTAAELQGTNGGSGNDSIIKKFNWMSDDPVTSLSGYNVDNPYDPNNAGKDLFTRYFHVNKKLSQSLNKSTKVDPNDLNNTLNLVYDRSTYEIIFAAPKKTNEIYAKHGDTRGKDKQFSNLGVYRIDKKTGKKVMYCYPGNESDCAEEFKGRDTDDEGNKIIHEAYRAKVRYGQSLAGVMPAVSELKFSKKKFGSWGWIIAPDRNAKLVDDQDYRDMPPYRFTRKEFASSEFTVPKEFKVESELSGNSEIGGDPNNPTLADNQRVLYHHQITVGEWPDGKYQGQSTSAPIQVFIHLETIDSANSKDASKHVVELSDLSYYKDDTRWEGQTYTPPILAGFTAVDDKFETLKNDCASVELSKDKFEKKITQEWENYKTIHPNENISLEDFKNKVHIHYRVYMAYDAKTKKYPQDTNYFLSLTYARNKYNVEFYNPGDLTPIASENLAYETNLSNRNYDGDVKSSEGTDVSFPNTYTFTLGGKQYTISRPSTVPNDYIFAGWARDAAGKNIIKDSDTTMPVNGIKLYSVWKKGQAKHTVTIDYNMTGTNGQEIQETRQFNHKDKLSESSINVPTRSGYDFYGWQIVKKGNSSVTPGPYAFGNGIVEDITLKAVWIKDTRYSATVNHVFLKPGYTIDQYKNASETEKQNMVERSVTQKANGLRAGLRYSAEASYRDAQHFPDQNYQSFEISKNSAKNTATFVYQAYNTRKYTIKYIDQNGKTLLPDKTVSSVNQKYDVAFYTPIAGFKPSELQQNVLYKTGADGKQSKIPVYTFTYNDVRVLKRDDDNQARPDNYTRYVFKVADGEQNMGSIADYNGRTAGNGGLVYDVIVGTKAYQMPLPQSPIAKKGYEFAGWTSKVYITKPDGSIQETVGIDRLPILSESQSNPKVVYTANFRLIAPKSVQEIIVAPGTTSLTDATKNKMISDLVQNSSEFPDGSEFSYADGERFDNTPGLHKIKVQVKMGDQTKTTDVFYRVLPNIVYGNEWEKFKNSDYAKAQSSSYVPLKFTTVDEQGEIIGKEDAVKDGDETGLNAKQALTVYVYKGQKVKIALPKAFGKDHNDQKYNYVFKGWKSTDGSLVNFTDGMVFDLATDKPYVEMALNKPTTYQAVYKKIDYVSGKSDSGEIPKDSVVAIFKPAPDRLWSDGTSGPKVFYVKKNSNVNDIKINYDGSEKSILSILSGMLTGATGWSQSSMNPIDKNNVKDKVEYSKEVTDWIMGGHAFQEFVAKQKPLAKPKGLSHALLAVQGVDNSLPKLEDYIENYTSELKTDPNISEVKVEYASKAPNVDNAATYTVPLKVTIKYKDVRDPQPYDVVGVLQVLPKLVPQDGNLLGGGTQGGSTPGSGQHGTTPGTTTEPNETVVQKITGKGSDYAKVTFENATDTTGTSSEQGSITGNNIFYVVKKVSDGVTAPQAVGKDYYENGYHYMFRGWKLIEGEIIDASGKTISIEGTAHTSSATVPSEHDATHASAVRSAFTAVPFTTFLVTGATTPTEINETNVINDKIYTSEEVKKWKFKTNARLQAVYDYVPDAIDASNKDLIKKKDALKNYTPIIFMPGFGHTWNDGESKPDIKYLRNFGEAGSAKNISLTKKEAEEKAKSLSGFMGWKIYGADGTELSADDDDTWNATSSRIFIAEQKSAKDVKTSSFVLSVGDEIPGLDKYVKNTDGTGVSVYSITGQGTKPKSSKGSSTLGGSNKFDNHVYKPGITTVTLSVTYPTDKTDKNGKNVMRTVKVPLHIHVLPNVIADQDLPANDTKESKYIAQNYMKLTYVAGNGGEMKSPVFTYWVRKGAENVHMPVPDVLANTGYVFKNWSIVAKNYSLDLTNNAETSKRNAAGAKPKVASDEQKEFLAEHADLAGLSFIAKQIRASEQSSFAALKNLLDLGGKENGITFNLDETIITANFEQMDSVEFKFSGKAIEGVPATFTLANLTRGVLNADGTTDINAKVSVDGKQFTVNALSSNSLKQLGISHSCTGSECKISGTPKIADGKKVVEFTFTSVDKYGRKAVATVDIEVLPEKTPHPEQPTPAPVPTPEIPFMPDFAPSVIPEAQVMEPEVEQPEQPEPEEPKPEPSEAKPVLAKTGSDTSRVASTGILSAVIAAIGLAVVKTGKHNRKREDNK